LKGFERKSSEVGLEKVMSEQGQQAGSLKIEMHDE
jgi:hypothetical protein